MKQNSSLASYITGFVLSIIFTLAAYFLIQIHVNSAHTIISHTVLIPALLVLAIGQFIIQLIFFLHLARESGARWRLAAFVATIFTVMLIVIASIWIMGHLNYNMMASPTEMNQYIQSQDGF